MGTQATIAVTRKGKVVCKVVCGCNGRNAQEVADWILREKTSDPQKILDACLQFSLGCPEDLVVQFTPTEYLISPDSGLSLEFDTEDGARYRDRFNEPCFNPRWANGGAAYSLTVEIEPEQAGAGSQLPKASATVQHRFDSRACKFKPCLMCPCPDACRVNEMCYPYF